MSRRLSGLHSGKRIILVVIYFKYKNAGFFPASLFWGNQNIQPHGDEEITEEMEGFNVD
ncbi:MAG TPA: hypothetical protein VD908_07940 [Cytophagales bacterium]|nr:hypothetical protein [Cytophagales bacterium]